jgi:hypothetical protein
VPLPFLLSQAPPPNCPFLHISRKKGEGDGRVGRRGRKEDDKKEEEEQRGRKEK